MIRRILCALSCAIAAPLSGQGPRPDRLSADIDRSVIVRKLLTYEGRVQRRMRVGRASPRW